MVSLSWTFLCFITCAKPDVISCFNMKGKKTLPKEDLVRHNEHQERSEQGGPLVMMKCAIKSLCDQIFCVVSYPTSASIHADDLEYSVECRSSAAWGHKTGNHHRGWWRTHVASIMSMILFQRGVRLCKNDLRGGTLPKCIV